MKQTKKLVWAGILVAVAVVGSTFSVPIFGSKAAPVQHAVNIFSAVLLGPVYAVCIAFVASLLRNLLGMGTLLAFPGSMIGACLAGVLYKYRKSIFLAGVGECLGTGILGALASYPIAVTFLGKAGKIGYFIYVGPFFLSTFVGTLVGLVFVLAMKKRGYIE